MAVTYTKLWKLLLDKKLKRTDLKEIAVSAVAHLQNLEKMNTFLWKVLIEYVLH